MVLLALIVAAAAVSLSANDRTVITSIKVPLLELLYESLNVLRFLLIIPFFGIKSCQSFELMLDLPELGPDLDFCLDLLLLLLLAAFRHDALL
jgi:hypothetical protein